MTGFDTAHDQIVTVFGGSGFLGRHVVQALAHRGWRIRIASRRPDLALHTQPTGRVGQITAVQANLRYPASLASAMRDASAVVNLVGVLSEGGSQTFEAVHTEGTRAVAEAARQVGINTIVHVSAIGADMEAPAAYARSKGHAEQLLREIHPDAIILRPSILFGPEDDFFNRFAALARFSPALPLMGGGHTRFQPVYVGDVAEVLAMAVSGQAKAATTYELGGPAVRTFKELMEFVCRVTGRRRLLVPLPFGAARFPAMLTETADKALLGLFPKMLVMTRDQLTMLQSDNVVSEAAVASGRTLEGLAVESHAMESIVPTYLYRFRKTGQFDRQRFVP